MSDSSDEDTASKGGGAGGRKSKTIPGLKLPFTLSPMKAKGQSSAKSSGSSVNVPPTMEEMLATVSSFLKELGSEPECDQALKEDGKLLRGNKNLRYGNTANAEQNVESDVAFVNQINSMINGVYFAGKDVFKNFMNSDVNILGMVHFVNDLADITKETTFCWIITQYGRV